MPMVLVKPPTPPAARQSDGGQSHPALVHPALAAQEFVGACEVKEAIDVEESVDELTARLGEGGSEEGQ